MSDMEKPLRELIGKELLADVVDGEVAVLYFGETKDVQEERAKKYRRAVNAHDELVAALRNILAITKTDLRGREPHRANRKQIAEIARAVLAKAEA